MWAPVTVGGAQPDSYFGTGARFFSARNPDTHKGRQRRKSMPEA
ncbi:hypothetical protein FTUN_5005 [Frigoriglobus tundricola]|uniref:Uncharacterized protein n=1 Tax=Frigoriglobus tundricola TaxID=2774151 RepID=A0A6M5YVV0_9BACT|nr:hypothetical protein FTUN_5005 [Frigoriglobus tundricola]